MLSNDRAQKRAGGAPRHVCGGKAIKNKEKKLARIEAAARYLFAEHGFEATTTRAIAARAHIAVGTLFLYFPEKRDLLVHMFASAVAAARENALATLPTEAPLGTQLMHLFGALFDGYERDLRMARVFVKELLFLDGERRTELLAITLGFYDQLTGQVEAAKQRGEVAPAVSAVHVANVCFSLYVTSLIGWLGGIFPDRALMEHQLRASIDLVLAGASGRRNAR
jgi:TetR/AcrR family fatty acid metabolism transcriptional regulator